MINKINDFLFDFLGLAIPGFISLILLSFPFFYTNKNEYDFFTKTPIQLIFLILLLSYILGHTVKVFSKIFYKFMSLIFDKLLFIKLFNPKNKIEKTVKNKKENSETMKQIFFGFFKEIKKFFFDIIKQIFQFEPPNYYDSMIYEKVIELLKNFCNELPGPQKNTNKKWEDNWYNIYKLSTTIIRMEKLETLVDKFLAKYNFYRSLSFLFFLNFFLLFYYNKKFSVLSELHHHFLLINLINFIIWLTFHEKYKRYWTLCGNEALYTLFYFVQKNIKK